MASTVLPTGHATSAIPDMTVAEIRRALGKLREMWATASPTRPLFICDILHNNKSIAEFSTEFEYGHHLKRHYKSVAQTTILNRQRSNAAGSGLPECDSRRGTAVPGPKGDVGDPFPFSATWEPKTVRGKRAFAEAAKKDELPAAKHRK